MIHVLMGLVSTCLSLMYLTDFNVEILKKDKVKNTIYVLVCLLTTIILSFQYEVQGVFIGFFAATVMTMMLAYQDLSHKEVDTEILIVAGVVAFPIIFINPMTSPISSLIGVVGIGGSLLLIAVLTKESIGFADAFLIAILGAMLGWQLAVTILIIAFVISSLFGLVVLTFKIKNKKDYIPFIPFILLSLMFVQFI